MVMVTVTADRWRRSNKHAALVGCSLPSGACVITSWEANGEVTKRKRWRGNLGFRVKSVLNTLAPLPSIEAPAARKHVGPRAGQLWRAGSDNWGRPQASKSARTCKLPCLQRTRLRHMQPKVCRGKNRVWSVPRPLTERSSRPIKISQDRSLHHDVAKAPNAVHAQRTPCPHLRGQNARSFCCATVWTHVRESELVIPPARCAAAKRRETGARGCALHTGRDPDCIIPAYYCSSVVHFLVHGYFDVFARPRRPLHCATNPQRILCAPVRFRSCNVRHHFGTSCS
jgi:hypothetical protein